MLKTLVLSLLVAGIGEVASAGDAGWASSSCASASGRTVLTTYSNWFGEEYRIYTLIIDGFAVTYDLRDENVTEEGDDGYLTIMKNGEVAFETIGGRNKIRVHQDPRSGTDADWDARKEPFNVVLTCKDYYPAP